MPHDVKHLNTFLGEHSWICTCGEASAGRFTTRDDCLRDFDLHARTDETTP